MVDRVGQTFSNYRLLRLLGQGGFAQVYLGEHIHLGSRAAIKVLDTRLVTYEQDQFLREARIVSSLEHPSIVHVLDCGVERGEAFLIMNYAPYGTLRQLHPNGSRLHISQVNGYVRQIATALQYVHEHKLIHRDVKPENMLRGQHKELLLSDFGVALASSTSSSHSTKVAAGTVAYMAPEQIMGRARAASDQYALGIVVYEWLCGERPFRGSFTEMCTQHLYAPPPSLREKQSSVSSELEAVVFKALSKEPEERFANIWEFASALIASSPRTTMPLVLNTIDEDEPRAIQSPAEALAVQGGFTTVQAIEKEHGEVEKLELVEPISQPEQTTLPQQMSGCDESSLGRELEHVAQQAVESIGEPVEELRVGGTGRGYLQKEVPKRPGLVLKSGRPITSRQGLLTATCLLLLIIMAPILYTMLVTAHVPAVHPAQQLGYSSATSKPAVTHSFSPTVQSRVISGSTMQPTSSVRIGSAPTNNVQPTNVPVSGARPGNVNGGHLPGEPSLAPTPVPSVTPGNQEIQRQVTGQDSASQTARATGQILMPATNANGILMIHMGCAPVNGKTFPAGMVIADAARIVNSDGTLTQLHAVLEVTVSLGPDEDKTVPVHIQEAGAVGNLASGNFVYQTTYSNTCGHFAPRPNIEDWHVWNDRAFTGGQDQQTRTTVQQSDIDNAASVLTPAVERNAIASIKSQQQANEHISVDPTCITNVTTNYAANDQVPNVTVTVTATCVGTLST